MSLNGERTEAEALVTAALDLAVLNMTSTRGGTPPAGRFSFRLGGANIAVDFRSEAGRIDLNAAPKELLTGLFTMLGARMDAADAYATRIVGWRTNSATGAADNETADYLTAGLPYKPRLGPFPHSAELSLVLGLPSTLVERALPFVTVYSGQP
jgi:general secretion pathway protein K